jgi:hypothetical protein
MFISNCSTNHAAKLFILVMLTQHKFRRVWVIQEVANAKTAFVQIGNEILSWDFFSANISELRAKTVDSFIQEKSAVKSVCLMSQLRDSPKRAPEMQYRPPLLEILEETRDFKSTLPSDKIYGVLTLAAHPENVEVDYSLDASEMFRRFAVACITEGQSLDVLYHCVYSTEPSELDVPSWTPDWTKSTKVEPFRIRGLKCGAARDTSISIRFDETGKKLWVRGRFVDKIAAVEEVKPIPFIPSQPDSKEELEEEGEEGQNRNNRMVNEYRKTNSAWIRNIFDIAFPDNVSTPQLLENLWRTFMCNRTRENEIPDSLCEHGFGIFSLAVIEERSPESVLKGRMQGRVALPDSSDTEKDHEIEARGLIGFMGAHGKWCYNRRFFRSAAGRFGWTVDGSQPDDRICVLHGGDYPFVLRPSEAGNYTIVGDCYIHGLMDGEALEPCFEDQDICLV